MKTTTEQTTCACGATFPVHPEQTAKHTINWYVAETGNHQGLIIDEKDGRNIAVSYDKTDAPLIAAAPELLAALKMLELSATKMLAGGFNGKMAEMHKAIGIATERARAIGIRATLAKAKEVS